MPDTTNIFNMMNSTILSLVKAPHASAAKNWRKTARWRKGGRRTGLPQRVPRHHHTWGERGRVLRQRNMRWRLRRCRNIWWQRIWWRRRTVTTHSGVKGVWCKSYESLACQIFWIENQIWPLISVLLIQPIFSMHIPSTITRSIYVIFIV